MAPAREHLVTWEFLPAPEREREFLEAYGSDGPWVALFRRAAGYLGTTLEPVAERPGWYRTVDRWVSPVAYDEFRCTFQSEYAALDRTCEALTADERQISNE